MKWIVLLAMFNVFDVAAYFSFDIDVRRSHVGYLIPGGGIVLLIKSVSECQP
jgi:hypothetical protein